MLSVFLKNDLIALLTCSAIVVIFIATGVFGRAELSLLGSRLRQVGQSLVTPTGSKEASIRESAVRMQGSLQWELLWETLVESAEEMGLSEIRLDVNSPAEQEGYHASWEQLGHETPELCWRMEFPLVIAGRTIGRVLIVGERNGESTCWDIQQLLDLVKPFEMQLLARSRRETPVPVPQGDLAVLESKNGQSSSLISQKHPK